MLEQTIGFVGSGQMARALARGFVQAGLISPDRVIAFDPLPAAAEQFLAEVAGAQVVDSNASIINSSDVVFLAVKPQHISAVAGEIRSCVSSEKLIVSIAAGVSLEALKEMLDTQRIIRVMPNTPCLIGQGAAGYSAAGGATAADCQLVGQLLAAVGIAFEVDESLLDAVTGLSGSGPAYVFTMIEALSDGGVRMGLPRTMATALAVQTVRGSAEMVRSTELHPAILRERVTSPGGTTIAGLKALEEYGVRAAIMAAVEAATERSVDLGLVGKGG